MENQPGSSQQQNKETNNSAPAQAASELSPGPLQELIAVTRSLGTSMASLVEEVRKLVATKNTAVEKIQSIDGHIQTVLAEVRTLATNSEVNFMAPPNQNSTLADADPEIQESDETSQLNVTANETFDRMNNTINKLQHTLETNLQKKVAIKRDYKVTNKSNFNTWLDSLNSELALNDLKEIIDQQEKFANDNTEKVVKQKQLIRDIIINHIDDHYHKKILGITEPNMILKKRIEARQIESNTTKITAKQKL